MKDFLSKVVKSITPTKSIPYQREPVLTPLHPISQPLPHFYIKILISSPSMTFQVLKKLFFSQICQAWWNSFVGGPLSYSFSVKLQD